MTGDCAQDFNAPPPGGYQRMLGWLQPLPDQAMRNAAIDNRAPHTSVSGMPGILRPRPAADSAGTDSDHFEVQTPSYRRSVGTRLPALRESVRRARPSRSWFAHRRARHCSRSAGGLLVDEVSAATCDQQRARQKNREHPVVDPTRFQVNRHYTSWIFYQSRPMSFYRNPPRPRAGTSARSCTVGISTLPRVPVPRACHCRTRGTQCDDRCSTFPLSL